MWNYIVYCLIAVHSYLVLVFVVHSCYRRSRDYSVGYLLLVVFVPFLGYVIYHKKTARKQYNSQPPKAV